MANAITFFKSSDTWLKGGLKFLKKKDNEKVIEAKFVNNEIFITDTWRTIMAHYVISSSNWKFKLSYLLRKYQLFKVHQAELMIEPIVKSWSSFCSILFLNNMLLSVITYLIRQYDITLKLITLIEIQV